MVNYQSLKILPYVYKLTHRVTGQFYFGARWANTVPSHEDLGIFYFTSGKYTKEKFHEFNYIILAEFYNSDDAYWFEQELIIENKKNPLLLNKHYIAKGIRKFAMSGPFSEEHKLNISKSKKGKTFSVEHKLNISKYQRSKPPASLELRQKRSINARNISEETREKMRIAHKNISNATREKLSNVWKGRRQMPEHTAKITATKIGRLHTAESKDKMRQSKIGRKHSAEAINNNAKSHMKPCTINGTDIFSSRLEMVKQLGWGKKGVRHPNFKYL